MIVPSTLSKAFCLTFGCLYPGYASFKAIKSDDKGSMSSWLMYWVVFGTYTGIEFILDRTLFWAPFYEEIKMAVVLWLVSPQTRGALIIYHRLLYPYLLHHEKEIDENLIEAGIIAQRLGSEASKKGAAWFQQNLQMAIEKGQSYLEDEDHKLLKKSPFVMAEVIKEDSKSTNDSTSIFEELTGSPISLKSEIPTASPQRFEPAQLVSDLEQRKKLEHLLSQLGEKLTDQSTSDVEKREIQNLHHQYAAILDKLKVNDSFKQQESSSVSISSNKSWFSFLKKRNSQ